MRPPIVIRMNFWSSIAASADENVQRIKQEVLQEEREVQEVQAGQSHVTFPPEATTPLPAQNTHWNIIISISDLTSLQDKSRAAE